jgi:hypothetical protein
VTQTIAPFEVECPSCATPFPVAPDRVPDDGVHAVCSICRRTFLVELPAELRDLRATSTAGGFTPAAQPDFSVPAPGEVAAAVADVDPGIEEEIELRPSESGLDDGIDFEVVAEPSGGVPEDVEILAFEQVEVIEEPDVEAVADVIEELKVDEVVEVSDAIGVETGPGVADVIEEVEVDDVVEIPDVPKVEAGPALTDVVEESEVDEVADVADFIEFEVELEEEVEAQPPAPSREPPPPDPAIENLSSLTDEVLAEAPAEEARRPTLSEGAARFGRRDPHERARRLARVLVSDIIAYYPEKHAEAVRRGTVREEFEDEVSKSWKEFVDQVGPELAEGTPYFKEALNEVLARGKQVY